MVVWLVDLSVGETVVLRVVQMVVSMAGWLAD